MSTSTQPIHYKYLYSIVNLYITLHTVFPLPSRSFQPRVSTSHASIHKHLGQFRQACLWECGRNPEESLGEHASSMQIDEIQTEDPSAANHKC